MAAETLPLESRKILEDCPQFRVLVVGKSGVGKSSLIGFAFGVDLESVSHSARGECNIDVENTSKQNPRFVVHDSMGFEPGQTRNFQIVRNFLQSRSGEGVLVKDRVHIIWLCIQVPFAGSRTVETGDEELLKLALSLKVPLVVVFTQFDRLLDRMQEELFNEKPELNDEEFDRMSMERANAKFQELCVEPLERISPGMPHARTSGLHGPSIMKPSQITLTRLVKTTEDLVRRNMGGDVWIVTAMAQRVSALQKINASVEIGMKRYWQGLASAASFGNSTLETCLATIHREITESWNFYDPRDVLPFPPSAYCLFAFAHYGKQLLNSKEFRDRIKALAQLVTPDEAEAKSWFENLEHIQTLLGLSTAIVASVAPAVAAIGLSALFVQWLSRTLQRTPEILRCLMGYILDITLVMDQLFLVVLGIHPPRALTAPDVDMALESYKTLNLGDVHKDVRRYADKATFARILRANNAEQKVKELIEQYQSKL